MSHHRVVSLIASATEIVAALGHADELVGRSHECDYPPSVERLTVCSEPRFDVHGTSREIDDRVRATVRDAVSVYRVLVQELQRLEPTVIITQTQCDVCAVNLRDVEAAVCELVGSRPRIVALEPLALPDIWTDIRLVAEALDNTAAGERLVGSLQTRLHDLAARVPVPERSSSGRPTVVCLEWLDPLMSAGNWVPELVEVAGGTPLLGEAGKHSGWMTWDDLRSADADVLLIMPCGFDIARTRRELNLLTGHPVWPELRAVRNGQVYLTDGNQFFNRPGPRVVESAEIIAEILWPETFEPGFGHAGTGWERLVDLSRGA